jgi:hypothetical protein
MGPAIALRLRQHLTLTPQVQQALRLLQMSALEFAQEFHETAVAQVATLTNRNSERIALHRMDVLDYDFPPEKLVLYIYNSFRLPIMQAAWRHHAPKVALIHGHDHSSIGQLDGASRPLAQPHQGNGAVRAAACSSSSISSAESRKSAAPATPSICAALRPPTIAPVTAAWRNVHAIAASPADRP